MAPLRTWISDGTPRFIEDDYAGLRERGLPGALSGWAIGLSVNRWYETPFEHPSLPAVRAYYERLGARPGFLAHGRNGVP